MKYIIVIISFFFTFNIYSQNIDSSFIYSPAESFTDTIGRVDYIQSEAISSIMNKSIIVNEANPLISGYRIQIYSVSGVNSKDKVNKEKAEFLLKDIKTVAYIVYQSPYFKLRIGDYRTKLEAYHYLQEIIEDYPFAFVVKDEINNPYIPLDDDNK